MPISAQTGVPLINVVQDATGGSGTAEFRDPGFNDGAYLVAVDCNYDDILRAYNHCCVVIEAGIGTATTPPNQVLIGLSLF